MRTPLMAAIMLAFLAVAGVSFVWVGLDFALGYRGGWWTKHFIDISNRQMVRQVAIMGTAVWLGVFLAAYL